MQDQDESGRRSTLAFQNVAPSIRDRLEENIRSLKEADIQDLDAGKIRKILHELQVHQLELEMQNEELRRVREELERSYARYFDFYNMSPLGYCTIGRKGLIVEVNLTLSRMLGVDRSRMAGVPLSRFIVPDDISAYYPFLKRVFEIDSPKTCQLRMLKKDGEMFWAALSASVVAGSEGIAECRLVMSDITDRKQSEDASRMVADLTTLINSPDDFKKLILRMITRLQEWSGCEAAGIRLKDGDDYPFYVSKGFSPEFLISEGSLCVYRPDGSILRDDCGNPVLEGLCGNMLSGRFDSSGSHLTAGGSFFSNDTARFPLDPGDRDCRTQRCRGCNEYGYQSVAVIPLRFDRQFLGLIQLNGHRPNRFNPAMMDGLEKMAENLTMVLLRRQAIDSMMASKAKLEAALASMTDAVFISDNNGRFVDFNDAFATFHKFKNKDECAKTLAEYPAFLDVYLESGDPVPLDRWAVPRALRGETGTSLEYRLCRKDTGESWYGNYSFAPIRDRDGNITGAVVTARDITQIKSAQEALRKSDELHSAILKTAMDGYLVVDLDGRILDANDTYCRMSGFGREELLTMGISDLEEIESASDIFAHIGKITTDGEGRFETRHRRKDNTGFDAEVSVQYKPMDGERMVAFIRDISERKRNVEEIHRLSQLLIQAQENERYLISCELHDSIAQNLSALKINFDLMRSDTALSLPELRNKLDLNSTLLAGIISDVRNLSYDLRLPGLDEFGLVKALESYCTDASAKGNTTINFISAGMSGIKLDGNREIHIYRLVQEGMSNIRKHAEAGQAHILLLGSYPYIILRMEDNGKGFDVKQQEILSANYKRMGLRSMAERVNLLNGQMTIQSQPMKGTRIFIKIPLPGKPV